MSRAPWGNDAISNLDSQHAQLGVVQKRLENIIANLQKIAGMARRYAAG
ncbi:flagellin [Pseudomonas iridis]|uniref:Flagellin n=1 Tax=Pseudomonas iridis TaxID=2710587 RepID=A0ABW8DFG9_9PSED